MLKDAKMILQHALDNQVLYDKNDDNSIDDQSICETV